MDLTPFTTFDPSQVRRASPRLPCPILQTSPKFYRKAIQGNHLRYVYYREFKILEKKLSVSHVERRVYESENRRRL